MNSHEVFIHIHQGCPAVTGATVRLPQCQRSKPDGHGKISQCITTTKHSKAKTARTPPGIYCTHLQTHASATHRAHIYWFARMVIPSTHLSIGVHIHTCAFEALKKKKNTYTHIRNNTNMHKYANIRIPIHAYIYTTIYVWWCIHQTKHPWSPHTMALSRHQPDNTVQCAGTGQEPIRC